jgi:glycine betaine/proline transport system substrate-binding protein
VPEVAAYFQRAHMPFAEMNTLLQNLNEPGATVENVADAFVAARGEIWQPWVGKPAN